MPLPQTSFAERQHNAAAAQRASDDRAAALACNDILTEVQASALLLAMDAMPQAGAILAEVAFEQYGWPSDSLDTSYLDRNGRATWTAFCKYRSA